MCVSRTARRFDEGDCEHRKHKAKPAKHPSNVSVCMSPLSLAPGCSGSCSSRAVQNASREAFCVFFVLRFQAAAKKRTFRKFSYRGVELEDLLEVPNEQLVKMFRSKVRRTLVTRGLKRKHLALLKRLRAAVSFALAHTPHAMVSFLFCTSGCFWLISSRKTCLRFWHKHTNSCVEEGCHQPL
jgi:small subunit ribosomal protein S15e